MEWMEVLMAVAVPTLAGAAGYGRLSRSVSQHDKDLEGKASKEVVDTKFDAVIERLDRIEGKLDRNSRSL